MTEPFVPFWPTVWRGIKHRCPACGAGALFRAYLKPVETCAACDEALGHIRADDGPAWLTILVSGHLMAPFFPLLKYARDVPAWVMALVLLVMVLGLTLTLLPSAKGLFIAVIWRAKNSDVVA